MRTCERRSDDGLCQDCAQSCPPIKRLDKRYRLKYRAAPLENLKLIRERGMDAFLRLELARWACSRCGGTLCMHTGRCANCDQGALLSARRRRDM